jgi:hypothetical protein
MPSSGKSAGMHTIIHTYDNDSRDSAVLVSCPMAAARRSTREKAPTAFPPKSVEAWAGPPPRPGALLDYKPAECYGVRRPGRIRSAVTAWKPSFSQRPTGLSKTSLTTCTNH